MADDDSEIDRRHEMILPLMEALGHVAQHWARLEFEINKVIWALTALEPTDGACLTAQIPSILPRLRALIALVNKNGASKELIQDLNRFSGTAEGLGRRRNRVIHDPWFYREYLADEHSIVEFGRFEITADRRLTYEIIPQTRKEVLDIAHDIIGIAKEFKTLRTRIGDELGEQLQSRLDKLPEGPLDFPIPDNET